LCRQQQSEDQRHASDDEVDRVNPGKAICDENPVRTWSYIFFVQDKGHVKARDGEEYPHCGNARREGQPANGRGMGGDNAQGEEKPERAHPLYARVLSREGRPATPASIQGFFLTNTLDLVINDRRTLE
jgi:hypothetical protein